MQTKEKDLIGTETRLMVPRGEGGWEEGEMGEEDQLHGEGWKLDFCWDHLGVFIVAEL